MASVDSCQYVLYVLLWSSPTVSSSG